MMNYEEIIKLGLELGLSEIELYIQTNEKNSIELFDQKLSKYNVSDTFGISIRGKYNDKMAYAYTESLEEESIKTLLNQLIANASSITATESEYITSSGLVYPQVEENVSDYKDVTLNEKIEKLVKICNDALAVDQRIVKIGECSYNEISIKTQIINSKGLNLERSSSYIVTFLGAVASDGNETKVNYGIDFSINFKDINCEHLVKEATEEALASLGAGSLETGSYEVIFNHNAASSLLQAFTPIFAGESAIRKLTPLVDKIDTKIMGNNITIIDDPFNAKGLIKYPFDDEGTPCYTKNIVENGVFKGFLHNLKTAHALNTSSTGNGFKSSISSSVSTNPSNLYLVPGDKSLDDMIASVQDGVLITDVSGLHAGVNAISGDFNLLASGFVIKDGKKNRPVTLLVVSGNFYDMMNDVSEIGNDLDKIDSVASPSIKVNKITISCK